MNEKIDRNGTGNFGRRDFTDSRESTGRKKRKSRINWLIVIKIVV